MRVRLVGELEDLNKEMKSVRDEKIKFERLFATVTKQFVSEKVAREKAEEELQSVRGSLAEAHTSVSTLSRAYVQAGDEARQRLHAVMQEKDGALEQKERELQQERAERQRLEQALTALEKAGVTLDLTPALVEALSFIGGMTDDVVHASQ